MSFQRHGISIGLDRVDEQFFVVIKAVGTLTHQDYEIIPIWKINWSGQSTLLCTFC